jgi:predicted Abi (CAAX) family protease
MGKSVQIVYSIYTVLYLVVNIVFLGISIVKVRKYSWGMLLVAGFSLPILSWLVLVSFSLLKIEVTIGYDVFLLSPMRFIGYLLIGIGISIIPIQKVIPQENMSKENDTNTQELKATLSNRTLGIVFLILAPILYLVLQALLVWQQGMANIIANPTPLSIAVLLGCIVASIAAFAGKFRLK